MVDLQLRAERLKLARLVALDPDELAFLEELPPAAVREVRERVADLLLDQGSARFDRLVAASRLLPDPVVAAVAQRVFPPLVCAQVAGSIDPGRVAGLVRHVDVRFLAEMAAVSDPRTIGHLIGELPEDVAVAGARELMARGDHLASGRLVGTAPDHLLPALVDAVDDEGDLLEIAFYLEQVERLDAIVSHVDDDRLRRVADLAADRGLWAEALLLAGHLGPRQLERLAAVVAEAPVSTVGSMLEAAHRDGLWADLLPLVGSIPDELLSSLAGHPFLRDEEVMTAILAASEATDGDAVVVRVVAAMSADAQDELTAAIPALPDDRRAALAATVDDLDAWNRLGPIAARLRPAG